MTTLIRKNKLINQLKSSLEEISGIDMEGIDPSMNFMQIGLDSLLLTQISLLLKKEYKLPITFRQLNEEYNTIDSLADYFNQNLPNDEPVENKTMDVEAQTASQVLMELPTTPTIGSDNQQVVIQLISQQIQLLAQQVALMSQPSIPAASKVTNGQNPSPPIPSQSKGLDLSAEELGELKKPFGAIPKIERKSSQLSHEKANYLKHLSERYGAKTSGSKSYTQSHRSYMADPRVVSGFKPQTKELTYSIVTHRSKGCQLWDIDGNEYIDMLNGFGSSMLGYQPDHIKAALHDQIEKGFEIGPQHELAGEVSKLFSEITNTERVGLCNTGSEAVLGAIRIARTVTGRSLIVSFTGSYHGIIDEVLVRGTKQLKSYPAASGILPESVENILVLEYGSEESLRIITEKAHEIAAVLVEPVQSRNPENQPIEFLKKLRIITEKSGTALVFDEVITGFRIHQRGAQGLFGIQADIATYGKVVGSGLSIGVIAGKRKFLDALDGGYWEYGNDSIPEVGVTYFAGTFVRHPLALAAAKATLVYLKNQGEALQEGLTLKANCFVEAINSICVELACPIYMVNFGSMMKIKYREEYPYSELLYVLMREKGVHIQDGFPCFMTEAHTQENLDLVINAFKESVSELTTAGFIPSEQTKSNGQSPTHVFSKNNPPVPNAKLGKDASGNPGWFIVDPERSGKYLQIDV